MPHSESVWEGIAAPDITRTAHGQTDRHTHTHT